MVEGDSHRKCRCPGCEGIVVFDAPAPSMKMCTSPIFFVASWNTCPVSSRKRIAAVQLEKSLNRSLTTQISPRKVSPGLHRRLSY